MKNFAKSFFCLLSLSSLLIFTTCEDNVGLGSSVDTDRPSVTITYPPAASDGARIKGVFELGGRWSDDKSLSSIKVTLTYKTTEKTVNAEGKEVSTTREDIAWTGNADINPDGTWKCRLNEKNDEEYKSTNGWKFCDGSYSVKAVAVDGAGRSSDPAARELTIDNTAPVIVLTEPSSVGASNNVTSYGRTVQFVGNFAEDDPLGISKLTVSLYDAGGSKLADADFTNIQNMDNSNPLIIAEYYDSDIDNRADANWAKWHWYETLYTASKIADYRNTTTATDEKFYFSLTAYDSAAEYNDFTGGSENKCGNETTVYYRGTTDMKTLISNKNSEFQDFTVFRLKQYLNGTNGVYEAYKDSADLESILDEAKCLSVKDDDISADISNTSTSQGNVYPVFTMNPANNPTYTIDGLAVNTSTTDTTHFTDGYPSYYSDSSISANIKVGLDKNNTIITNTVSIYYTKEGETEKNLFWTWNKTVAREYAQKKGLDMAILSDSALESSSLVPDEYRFTPTADSENSSEVKVSASLSVVKKDIIAGKKYTFTVEGHDITGQNILASSDEGYGFFAKSNSEAPTINIGDENGNINIPSAGVIKASVLSDGSFGFTGTVFSPAEEISSSAITYDVTVADTTDSINKNAKVEKHVMAAFAEDEAEQNKYTYNWSFNFTQTPAIASLIADGQGLYTVDVTINATNGGGTMKLPRSYFLDTVNPAVSNVAVSGSYQPSDDKFFINSTKTFTLSGNTTDNYIVGSTKYEFIGKDSSGNAKTVSDSSTAISWSFTNINLSSFKAQENADDVILRITVTDKAGNKSVKEFSIEFDDTEPAGKHIYDKNSKDVIFRVGEGDNDLAELKAWNSGITALADKDKDVGGKYQAGTWGSAQTITIRGDWIEEGSGVKMIYYKIFDAEPDAAAIAAFKADPAAQKTGSIAPLSAPVTKRISYTDSTGSRSFTDTQYSFKQAISGFNAEKNYLLLAAEDNVGNIGIDTLKASDINDGSVSANTVWNRNLDSFSLNVDTEPPLLSSSTSGSQYTNKVAAIALSGTATDNASGVSSVTIKIGDTVIAGTSEVPVTIADTGTTENKSVTWTTSVPAAKLSSLEQGQSYNVNATVTDKAGNASSSTIFTLQVDTEAPEISMTAPSVSSTINGVIDIMGTTSYSGAVPAKLELYYSTQIPSASSRTENMTKIGSDITESSRIYSWTIENFDSYGVFTDAEITSKLVSKKIYLVPVVTDGAGNCNIYTESSGGTKTYDYSGKYFEYTVDKNKDRPVITVTSMSNASSWLTDRIIRGNIIDDDGISLLRVSENNFTWQTVEVDNGSWSYSVKGSDGEGNKLYFEVTDSRNKVFKTGDDDKFSRPYYKFSNTQDSEFASGDYGLDNNSPVSIKLDTAKPQVYTAGLADGSTLSLNSASDVKNDTDSYIISSSRYAGGTEARYIRFYVPAYDANISADGVKITIKDAGTGTVETADYGASGDTITLEKVSPEVTKTADGVTYKYYATPVIDVSSVQTGLKTVTIAVSDAADNVTETSANFFVDNTGPENITVTSPTSSDQVTGKVNITGIAIDEGIGLEAIEWLIPPADYSDLWTDEQLAALSWRSDNLKSSGGTSLWQFNFGNDQDNKDLTYFDNETEYHVTYDSEGGIYTIPFFLKTTDTLGNYYIKRDYHITHNPDGDRPKVSLSYPTEADYDKKDGVVQAFATLAGTIRVSGTVEIPSGTCAVDTAYIQTGLVADDGSVTWNKNASSLQAEFTALGGVVTSSTIRNAEGEEFGTLTYFDDGWWGIPAATKTATWNISLNKNNDLNPPEGKTTNIAIRACAVNEQGKLGTWSEFAVIHIDNNAPKQSPELRRYSSFDSANPEDNVILSTNAENTDSYLRGVWYLAVELNDNDSINEDSIKIQKDRNILYAGSGYYTTAAKTETDGSVSKMVYIPVDTTAIAGSAVSYTIDVSDNSGFKSSRTYSYSIDNTAPQIEAVFRNEKLADDGSNEIKSGVTYEVYDSDYIFTLGGTVKETGSGFDKVVFQYVRDAGYTVPCVLDPFVQSGHTDARAVIADDGLTSVSVNDDDNIKLYGKNFTGGTVAGSDGTYTFTQADVASNAHIHAGGLIYIGGGFGIITKKEESTVTFSMDASLSADNDASAFFPYAQVVNNTGSEVPDNMKGTGFTFKTNDDGDEMPESISGSRTIGYTWSGTMHTGNIPDGPVKLVVIAFDAAGNASSVSRTVKIVNNAPRLAKVYLGTDLNSNGIWEANEFDGFNVYNVNDSYGITAKGAKDRIGITSGGFTIKKGLAVAAEIVGGNEGVKMVYSKGASGDSPVKASAGTYGTAVDFSTLITDRIGKIEYNNVETDPELYGFTLTNASLAAGSYEDKTMGASFTFWDKTQETEQGSTSQNCVLYVKDFKVDLTDGNAPKAVVNPFYWISSSKNSLYKGSAVNGHIELESDWTAKNSEGEYVSSGYKNFMASETGYTGAEYDADPKVSGKVTFTGTAFDDHTISKLEFSFDGFDGGAKKTIAEYNTAENTWVKSASAIAAGYEVSLVSAEGKQGVYDDTVYFGQKGHKVYWTVSIDTEQISTVAAGNCKFTVYVTDLAGNTNAAVIADHDKFVAATYPEDVYTVTDGTTDVPYYQVDIVPYIVGFKTNLSKLQKANSSVYDRTALGHYAVSAEESVYLYGFNLEGGSLHDSKTASVSYDKVTPDSTFGWYASSFKYADSVYKITYDTEESKTGISEFTSGSVYADVGGIRSLNNENCNDSYGAYEAEEAVNELTGTYSVYKNYYNRQPNSINNNLLTDDAELDVWQINPEAVKPVNGYATQPVMAINPDNKDVGFAFVNGTLFYSMPHGNKGDDTHSYDLYIGGYDFWTSVGLAYDKLGYSYGTAAGGDIADNRADTFRIMTSRWARANRGVNGYNDGKNQYRLEFIAQADYNSAGNLTRNFNKERVRSPSLATTSATADSTTVYLAYYDEINDEIRFKRGEFTNTRVNDWQTNRTTDAQKATFFGDYYGEGNKAESAGKNTLEGHNGDYRLSHNSLIAGQTKDKYTKCKSDGDVGAGTLHTMTTAVMTDEAEPEPVYAGKYVSIAAIENGGDGDDAVIAVWWDAENNQMLYSYNTKPNSINVGEYSQADTGWTTPVAIFGEGNGIGEYCKVTVTGNSVHIAAYDGLNGDVWYAYIPNYADPDTKAACIVDSYGIIGTELNIDVGLDKNDNPVPYISYYAGSCARPKTAHWTNASPLSVSSLTGGAEEEAFTGAWEVSIVPSGSKVSVDHINIGLWKDSNTGRITGSKTGTTELLELTAVTESGNGYESYGNVYGNGTENPILGYAITKGSAGFIETAQMK